MIETEQPPSPLNTIILVCVLLLLLRGIVGAL